MTIDIRNKPLNEFVSLIIPNGLLPKLSLQIIVKSFILKARGRV